VEQERIRLAQEGPSGQWERRLRGVKNRFSDLTKEQEGEDWQEKML